MFKRLLGKSYLRKKMEREAEKARRGLRSRHGGEGEGRRLGRKALS